MKSWWLAVEIPNKILWQLIVINSAGRKWDGMLANQFIPVTLLGHQMKNRKAVFIALAKLDFLQIIRQLDIYFAFDILNFSIKCSAISLSYINDVALKLPF